MEVLEKCPERLTRARYIEQWWRIFICFVTAITNNVDLDYRVGGAGTYRSDNSTKSAFWTDLICLTK
jgi:hypothetical protein